MPVADSSDCDARSGDRLPAELLEKLAREGSARSFSAHTVLIQEGDTGDALYIVLDGRVKAYSESDRGREFVLGEFGPGEYLGELSLDGERRSVSVMTMEPTRCCVVPGVRLRQFMFEHPDFAWHLTRKLTHLVRRLTEQVKSLALEDTYRRIARLLVELSEPMGDVRVVRQKLTQQDIADRVGSSREMVNRVMKDLTNGGYLFVDGDRQIVIRGALPAAW